VVVLLVSLVVLSVELPHPTTNSAAERPKIVIADIVFFTLSI
jgi:hypothetical protein